MSLLLLASGLAGATPVPIGPVDIRGLPPIHVEDSVWTTLAALAGVLAAIMSAAVALATYKLARDTARLAAETRAAIEAEDRRHRDTFRPHLALGIHDVEALEDDVIVARTKMTIRNIGPGFAQNIVATQIPMLPKAFEDPLPIALAVGEARDIALNPDFEPDVSFDYSVRYEDAFGTAFESRIGGTLSPNVRYTSRRLS